MSIGQKKSPSESNHHRHRMRRVKDHPREHVAALLKHVAIVSSVPRRRSGGEGDPADRLAADAVVAAARAISGSDSPTR
jgi:hypothetical protein